MTQEQHQNASQAPILTEELPIRRSRSLSELPGHIRVPILRRQDTARTQARLRAGAAGVEELHALREQQQLVIDQTMKAARQKRKQPTPPRLTHTIAGHHRLQHKQFAGQAKQQQIHNSNSPLSAWHSTNHLTSISEEWDITPNEAAKKCIPGSSINVINSSNCQDNTQNNVSPTESQGHAQNNCDSLFLQAQPEDNSLDYSPGKSESATQPANPENKLQHNNKEQNGSWKQSCPPNMEEPTSTDKHISTKVQDEELSHKSATKMPIYNNDQDNIFTKTRSRSMSHTYIQYKDNQNVHNSQDMCHKQSIHSKSGQHFSRGRSQSVDTNFVYLSDAKENGSERKLPKQTCVQDDVLPEFRNSRPDTIFQTSTLDNHRCLQDEKPKTSSISFDQFSSAVTKNSSLGHKDSSTIRKYGKPSWSHLKTSVFHQSQMFSPQSRSRSKSISWDNLLVAIGLHNESTCEVENQDYEINDDVFTNSAQVSNATNEHPASLEIEMGCSVQIKKMRSQSFTSGCLLNPNYKSGILKTEYSAQGEKTEDKEFNKMMKRHSIEHYKQPAREINSTSFLRRASIQCEAVLTQTGTPKRVLNPLQDVNFNSLLFPGPLHAVTLQYTSVPMRNASDLCGTTASSGSAANIKKTVQSELIPKAQVSLSAVSSHSCDSLHLANKNDHLSESETEVVHVKSDNSKADKAETSHSNLVQQNSFNEHPVPLPRTSISKAFSQTPITHASNNTAKEVSERHKPSGNFTKEGLSSEDTKSNTSQLQNSVGSDPSGINQNNSFSATQPTLSTMKSTGSSDPASESHRLFTKSQHKDVSKCKQNSELNRPVTDSTTTKNSSSCAELGKEESRPLKEKERKNSVILENLSIWMNSHRVNKANCGGDKPVITLVGAPVGASLPVDVLQPLPSFHCTNHTTGDKSQIPKVASNVGKSSFYFSSQKHASHTPDVSVFSDEGYSTCDSISQQSQLCQGCDINSPCNGSTVSVSYLDNLPCSSENCCNSLLQTQCIPSNLKANEETRVHNSDEESARSNCVTHNLATDILNLNVQQGSTVKSKLDPNQTNENPLSPFNHNCNSKDKKTTHQTVKKRSSQKTTTDTNSFTVVVDNNKSNREEYVNINVARLDNKEKIGEGITCGLSDVNDTVQRPVKVATHLFKQTAV